MFFVIIDYFLFCREFVLSWVFIVFQARLLQLDSSICVTVLEISTRDIVQMVSCIISHDDKLLKLSGACAS